MLPEPTGTVKGFAGLPSPPRTLPRGSPSIFPIPQSGEIVVIGYRVTSEAGVSQCDLEPVDIIADEDRVVIEGDAGVFSLVGAFVEDGHSPETFSSRVRPNPATGMVDIVLVLPVASGVTVSVYDPLGRLVRPIITDALLSSGQKILQWDRCDRYGNSVSPDIYFIEAEIGKYRESHRLVVLE
jgi:hypothetical protein